MSRPFRVALLISTAAVGCYLLVANIAHYWPFGLAELSPAPTDASTTPQDPTLVDAIGPLLQGIAEAFPGSPTIQVDGWQGASITAIPDRPNALHIDSPSEMTIVTPVSVEVEVSYGTADLISGTAAGLKWLLPDGTQVVVYVPYEDSPVKDPTSTVSMPAGAAIVRCHEVSWAYALADGTWVDMFSCGSELLGGLPPTSTLARMTADQSLVLPAPWAWQALPWQIRYDSTTLSELQLPSATLPAGTTLQYPITGGAGRAWWSEALPDPVGGFHLQGEGISVFILANPSLWPDSEPVWEVLSCEEGQMMCVLESETTIWVVAMPLGRDGSVQGPQLTGKQMQDTLRAILGS